MRYETVGDYILTIPEENEALCTNCLQYVIDINKLPVYYPIKIIYPGQKSLNETMYKCPYCGNLFSTGTGGIYAKQNWQVRKENDRFVWFREELKV